MKLLTSQFERPFGNARGFSLLLVLTLILLVTAVVVALSTMVSVESRNQSSSRYLHEARQNALLAMNEAVAALQTQAGPDQRVTAMADILGTSVAGGGKYWTGIWDNRLANGNADNPYTYGDNRNQTTGKLSTPPKWLVSSTSGNTPDPTNIPASLGGSGNTVTLVSATSATTADAVEAGKVSIEHVVGAQSRTVGHYAWWVGDEGVKANLALRDRLGALSHAGARQTSLFNAVQLQTAQIADPRRFTPDNSTNSVIPVNDPMLDLMTSPRDLLSLPKLSSPGSGPDVAWLKKNRHAFTVNSLGLQSDTWNGGLKLDLSRGLEEQWVDFLTFLRANKSLMPPNSVSFSSSDLMQPIFKVPGQTGVTPGTTTTSDLYGPYWDVLYSYYHIPKDYQPMIPDARSVKESLTTFSSTYRGYIKGWRSPVVGADASSDDETTAIRIRGNPSTGYGDVGPVAGGFRGSAYDTATLPRWDQSYHHWSTGTRPATQEMGVTNLPVAKFYEMFPTFRSSSVAGLGSTSFRGDPTLNSIGPVVVKYQVTLAVQSILAPASEDPTGTKYYLRLYLYPQFVLWNPYNTSLRPRYYYLRGTVKFPFQIKAGPTGGSTINLFDGGTDPGSPGPNDGLPDTGMDLARIFHTCGSASVRENYGIRFPTKQIGFGPGEARVFTLGATRRFANSDVRGIFGSTLASEDSYTLRASQYNPTQGIWVNARFTPLRSIRETGDDSDANKTRVVATGQNPKTANAVPLIDKDDTLTLLIFAGTAITNSGGSAPSSVTASQARVEVEPLLANTPDALAVPYIGGGGVNYPTRQGLFDSNLTIPLGTAASLTAPTRVFTFEWEMKSYNSSDTPVFSVYNPRSLTAQDIISPILRGQTDLYLATTPSPSATNTDVQLVPGTPPLPFIGSSYTTSGQTRLALFENPIVPPSSIGDFMHANLSLAHPYPAFAVGSSFASPYIAKDSYQATVTNAFTGAATRIPDISYLLNNALFDGYFFSTTPPNIPSLNSGYYDSTLKTALQNQPPFEPVDAAYIEANKPLPNGRMRYLRGGNETAADFLTKLRDSPTAFRTAASKLGVQGAFNINSTSVAAWKAFLAGAARDQSTGLTFVTASGGNLSISNSDGVIFSRFSNPVGASVAAASPVADGGERTGVTKLTETQLDTLAQQIVAEVKLRGPFLSLADFVNRRLSTGPTGDLGPLQAAIEASGLNDSEDLGNNVTTPPPGGLHPPKVRAGLGVPGSLLQNDILRGLAPAMASRSDTFVIRFYGDAVNPSSGKLEARAYGEAVVQRYPDFVDTAQPPETLTADLNATNKALGRRFKVVSFHWMNEDEI